MNITSPFIELVKQLCAERGIRVWLVGGAVRDVLSGRTIHDWDFAVERDAIPLGRTLADRLAGDVYILDRELDMARVLIDDDVIDLARARGGLEPDLAGRDFTINALAIDLAQPDRVIDLYGGQTDLAEGVIRAISETALTHDPVRMLRAVRQSASLALAIDPQTAEWITRYADQIVRSPGERVRDELNKTLAAADAADSLLLLDAFGLLSHVLPEVAALKGVTQSLPHHWDVYEHTRRVVDALELIGTRWLGFEQSDDSALMARVIPDFVWDSLFLSLADYSEPLREHLLSDGRWLLLKWAALLHDVGKPPTKTVEEAGRTRFFGHEDVGVQLAVDRLRALRFSNDEIARVTGIIGGHMRPHFLAEAPLTRRAQYRFFRDAGDYGVDILLLSMADHLATHGPDSDLPRWVARLGLIAEMFDAYFGQRAAVIAPPPLVNGNDIMQALGLPPGKQIGVILEAIREAQASGVVRTEAEALALAQEVLNNP